MDRADLANVGAHRWMVLVFALALGACDGEPLPDGGPIDSDAGRDAGADAGSDAGPEGCEGPPGLYVEGSCEIAAPGVRRYTPRFALWSDGAVKERFIYLPPDTQITTDDPNNWAYPVGTRVYKTFSHGGVRLETRLLEKHDIGTGPSAWYMRTFAWNEAQDRVTEVTDADEAARTDVLGTDHDIPSGGDCASCHSGTLDVVNSFTAIQLNHADAGVTLEMLNAGWLTTPVDLAEAQIPGTETEVAALGYLHANCGNCHRPTPRAGNPDACNTPACNTGLQMWVNVGFTSSEATATYQTAVAEPTFWWHMDLPESVRCRVHPGEPDLSLVHFRMAHPRGDSAQMPPLGTEFNDPDGIATIRAWISDLTQDESPCLPAAGP